MATLKGYPPSTTIMGSYAITSGTGSAVDWIPGKKPCPEPDPEPPTQRQMVQVGWFVKWRPETEVDWQREFVSLTPGSQDMVVQRVRNIVRESVAVVEADYEPAYATEE